MNRSAPLPTGEVDQNALLRLDVAARLAFPDGSISLSSLRREAARGRLTIFRVANKDMTTLAEIGSMIERCRVKSCLPTFGSDQQPKTEVPHGLSSTEDAKLAQVAARMRVAKLKENFSNTSLTSGTRTPRRNVVPIKPR